MLACEPSSTGVAHLGPITTSRTWQEPTTSVIRSTKLIPGSMLRSMKTLRSPKRATMAS